MTHVLRILSWLCILLGSALVAIWLYDKALMLGAAAGFFALATTCLMILEGLEKP